MTTKNMKGLFKGLRYIGQIFDEENKDDEIQIGFPTDVKHVAHIGWDGPSQAAADANPSWMKEFKANPGFQSGPLDSNGNNAEKENPEIKWVSEDSKKGKKAKDSHAKDLPEVPKASRRRNSSDTTNINMSSESPKKKDSSTKPRQSRRHNSKDSSEGSVRSSRQLNESGQPGSPSKGHADGEKKTRRKKSKDTDGGGGSTRSRAKDAEGSSKSRSKPAPSGPDPGAD